MNLNSQPPRSCGVVLNILPLERRLEALGFVCMDLETVIAIAIAAWDHAQDHEDIAVDLQRWLHYRSPDFFQAEIVRRASYAGMHYGAALNSFVAELTCAVEALLDVIDQTSRPVLEMFIYAGGWRITELVFFGNDSCLIRYDQYEIKSTYGDESLLYRLDTVYSRIERDLRAVF